MLSLHTDDDSRIFRTFQSHQFTYTHRHLTPVADCDVTTVQAVTKTVCGSVWGAQY